MPVIDTVYVMLRRMVRGQNPFHADRRHIHHTLIFMGLTPGQSCGVLLGLSTIFGAVGFFGWFYGVPEYLLTYGFLATFAVHCVFMQMWREVLGVFGYRHRRVGDEKAGLREKQDSGLRTQDSGLRTEGKAVKAVLGAETRQC